MLDLLFTVSTPSGTTDRSRGWEKQSSSGVCAADKETDPDSTGAFPLSVGEDGEISVPGSLKFVEQLANCFRQEGLEPELDDNVACVLPVCADPAECEQLVLPKTSDPVAADSDQGRDNADPDERCADILGAGDSAPCTPSNAVLHGLDRVLTSEGVDEKPGVGIDHTAGLDGNDVMDQITGLPETVCVNSRAGIADAIHEKMPSDAEPGDEPPPAREISSSGMILPRSGEMLVEHSPLPLSESLPDMNPETIAPTWEPRVAVSDLPTRPMVVEMSTTVSGEQPVGGGALGETIGNQGDSAAGAIEGGAAKEAGDPSLTGRQTDLAGAVKDRGDLEQEREFARSAPPDTARESIGSVSLELPSPSGDRSGPDSGGSWSTTSFTSTERMPSTMPPEVLLRNLGRLVLQAARADDHFVRVELEPAALGRVLLQCRETSSGLVVEMVVRDETIRLLLSAQESILRGQLEARGLALEEFSVTCRDRERANSRQMAKDRLGRDGSGIEGGIGAKTDLGKESVVLAWMADGARNYWVA